MRKQNSFNSVQVTVREIQQEWSSEERLARLTYGVERRAELIAKLFGDCSDDGYLQAG